MAAAVALSLAAVAQSHEDSSALLQAAFKGEASVVREAIEKGADPNQKDKNGTSLLAYASNGGHLETVAALLSLGASPNGNGGDALWGACNSNNMPIACMLVEAGANTNLRGIDNQSSALYEACFNNNIKLARYLLDHGANPNLPAEAGWTPLMTASQRDPEMAALLLQRGAKVDQRDKYGSTALMFASREGKVETAKALILAGAEVDASDSVMGMTPLYQAAGNGHADIVKVLLKAKADPNARATKRLDSTPLMAAARCGSLETVNVLLNGGADPKAVDTDGHTALMYAAISAKDDVLLALVKAGTPVNAVDSKGESALFAAYQGSNQDAVTALLHFGADPAIKDAEGKQAADYALPQQRKQPLLKNNSIVPETGDLRKEAIPPAPH